MHGQITVIHVPVRCCIYFTFTCTQRHTLTPRPPVASPLQSCFHYSSWTPGAVSNLFSSVAPIWCLMMNRCSLISAGSSWTEKATNLTVEPKKNLIYFKVNAWLRPASWWHESVHDAKDGARSHLHPRLFDSIQLYWYGVCYNEKCLLSTTLLLMAGQVREKKGKQGRGWRVETWNVCSTEPRSKY